MPTNKPPYLRLVSSATSLQVTAADLPTTDELRRQLREIVQVVFLRDSWDDFPVHTRAVFPEIARVVDAGFLAIADKVTFGSWAYSGLASSLREWLVQVPVGLRDADEPIADAVCDQLQAQSDFADWLARLGPDAGPRCATEQVWFFQSLAYWHNLILCDEDAPWVIWLFQAVWVARNSKVLTTP